MSPFRTKHFLVFASVSVDATGASRSSIARDWSIDWGLNNAGNVGIERDEEFKRGRAFDCRKNAVWRCAAGRPYPSSIEDQKFQGLRSSSGCPSHDRRHAATARHIKELSNDRSA